MRVVHRYDSLRTKTHWDGGKKPVWNETVELAIKYVGDDIELEVKDEN